MQFDIKAIFYSLLLSVFLVSCVKSNCEVFINELNIIDPKKPANKEYIELKSSCGDEISLRGYKIIGFNCQSNTGTIDLVVTLWNSRVNKNGFFTIGGAEVPIADLKVPSDYIKFKSSFDDRKVQSITNFLANKDLRAIGLLYDKKKINTFSDFSLSKKQQNIKINDAIIDQLKNHLIDLVVYGENKACDKCKLFERINDEFALKKFILREFPTNKVKKDMSLNRCAVESTGFLPEKFKLGDPSPGKPNDCTGPHFLLEEYIPVNVMSAYVDDNDDFESTTCLNQPTCTTTISTIDSDNDMIEQEISAANETSTMDICTSLLLYPDGSNIALTVEQENSRKRHFGTTHDYSEELEWQTTKFFR